MHHLYKRILLFRAIKHPLHAKLVCTTAIIRTPKHILQFHRDGSSVG